MKIVLFILTLTLSLNVLAKVNIDGDIDVLYSSALQMQKTMLFFEEKIIPINKATAEAKYPVLTLAENELVNEFWTTFVNTRIVLAVLQETYKDASLPDLSPEEQAKVSFLKYSVSILLLSPAVAVVKETWKNDFLRHKLDIANPKEIPPGSFHSLQYEVFKRTHRKAKELEEEKTLIPTELFENVIKEKGGFENGNLPLTERIQAIYQNVLNEEKRFEENKGFMKSRGKFLALKLRNVGYHFVNKLYDPIFKKISTWIGDTKVSRRNKELHYGQTSIDEKKAGEFISKLLPGDIVLARGDYFLSNVFLPGFWSHATVYTGGFEEFSKFFNADEETNKFYKARCEQMKLTCVNFSEYLAANPKTMAAWINFMSPNEHGQKRIIAEAISDGVVFSGIQSIMADYLSSLRPKISILEKARSMEEVFKKFGLEYDFDFDWATDDKLVCSELVSKVYKPDAQLEKKGIEFEYDLDKKAYFIIKLGRLALPPTQLLFKAYDENVLKVRPSQLEFVAFLKGNEKTNSADFRSEEEFYKTRNNPSWTFMQTSE